MKNLFERLKTGLAKTHNSIAGKIDGLFSSGPSREELAEMLEQTLITADVGVRTSGLIVD
ncbi:MAG: signal recognition particle-docking protein FtsY, partial [Deltaproteobacteria bacterium]|nr:signal recognition particle-docking protein FtsY [Deltaproteobacteria bacterium]